MHPVLQHALEDTGLQRRLVAARTDDALVELLRELDLAADPRGEIEAARSRPCRPRRNGCPSGCWTPAGETVLPKSSGTISASRA